MLYIIIIAIEAGNLVLNEAKRGMKFLAIEKFSFQTIEMLLVCL